MALCLLHLRRQAATVPAPGQRTCCCQTRLLEIKYIDFCLSSPIFQSYLPCLWPDDGSHDATYCHQLGLMTFMTHDTDTWQVGTQNIFPLISIIRIFSVCLRFPPFQRVPSPTSCRWEVELTTTFRETFHNELAPSSTFTLKNLCKTLWNYYKHVCKHGLSTWNWDACHYRSSMLGNMKDLC